MRRREVLGALGAAMAWPHATQAQQPAMPVIGFLGTASAQAYTERIGAISQGLKDKGFVEGTNLKIEYRWAEGHFDKLPGLAANLVERKVHLIIATGGSQAPLSAKAATTTIPIVFSTDGDPVKEGLVASFNRPGGNATGITVLTTALAAKRLEIFRNVVPDRAIAVLVNRSTSAGVEQSLDAEQAGQSLGQKTVLIDVTRDTEIVPRLAELANTGIGGLMITASPLFMAIRSQLVESAHRHRMPTLGPRRDFITAGAR